MRKMVFLFTIFLSVLIGLAFAQQDQNELLSREVMEKIAGEVSGKIAYEHIRDLTVFCKWYGSDDMIKAAEQIVGKAKKYGLSDAHVEKFMVDDNTYYYMQKPWLAWNCESGELRMVKPYHELISSYDANGPCVLVNSRDSDVEAEVVYVGRGMELKDYEGKDVKGKIVLATGNPLVVSRLAVFQKGAAGILSAMGIERAASMGDTTIYQTIISPWNEDKTKFSTFGFSLSANQGNFLFRLLEKGEKVILHAKVKAEVRAPGYHPGVVATIPGTTYPDEEIIFTAHLDHPRPGAHDNNSGCATLLEVARTLKSLIDQKLIEPPKRTLRFFWTPHVWGCDMLFSTYPEQIAKTITDINIDCVGLNQTKISSAFTVILPPYSRASFVSDVFNNLLNYLIICNNSQRGQVIYGPEIQDHDGSQNIFYGRAVPYWDFSDHIFFNSGSVGVPAVMFIDLPFGSHHSQNDKIEFLDPTQLKRAAFLAASAAYTIASAGPEESYKIIDEIYHRGRTRIEMEMKLAKANFGKADKNNVAEYYKSAHNLIMHGFRREYQALNSVKLFIKESKEPSAYLNQTIGRMQKFEKECLTEILEFYQMKCGKLGIKAEMPQLTAEELELKNIVPVRNPELKGTLGVLNEYGVDKYAYQKFSPMITFYYELLNFMDGKRNMLEVYQAVQAEALSANCEAFSIKDVMEYLKTLKQDGVISY
jgi:aminopeptidase YwaD